MAHYKVFIGKDVAVAAEKIRRAGYQNVEQGAESVGLDSDMSAWAVPAALHFVLGFTPLLS